MASSNTTLAVKFTGNPDDLIRVIDKIKHDMNDMSGSVDASFQKVSGSADKHTSKIKKSFESMGSSIKNSLGGLGGGGFAAIAGIGALGVGLDGIVKAAEQAQTSTASFNRQLATVGVTNKGAVSGISSLIEKMALQSGFAIPHLQAAYTQLIVATRSTADAHKYLQLSMDIAREKNLSVEQAAKLVSRAYVSGGTSLRRYGIAVSIVTTAQTALKDQIAAYTATHKHMDQAEKDHFSTLMAAAKLTDKQSQATHALADAQKIFSGQSAAYSNTAAGAQARLGVAFDILKIKLGSVLLPVIAAVATAMSNWLTWVVVNWPKIDHAIQPVLQNIKLGWDNYAKPAIQNLVAAVQWLVSQIQQNWNTIYGILNPFWVYFKNAFQNIVTIIQGVVLIIKGIFTGNWKDIWNGMKDVVGGNLSQVKNLLQLAVTEIGTIAGDIGKAIYNGITNALTGLGDGIVGIVKAGINVLIDDVNGAINLIVGNWPNVPGLPGPGSVGLHKNMIAHLASGGVVPGPAGAGDVIPAMLSPGEVVLNPIQQTMLGTNNIMRALASTGGVIGGNRFASGGMARLSGSQQTGAKAIIQVYTQHGLDPASGIAVALNESNLNPTAVGDGGTSFGLFQLHRGGALPAGWTAAMAFDPVKNATVAANAVAAAGGRHLSGHALQVLQTTAFERPKNTAGDESLANYNAAVGIVAGAGVAANPHSAAAKKLAAAHAQTPSQLAQSEVAGIIAATVKAGKGKTPDSIATAEMHALQTHLNAATARANKAKASIARLNKLRSAAVARLATAKKPAQKTAARTALHNIDAALHTAYGQASAAEYEIHDLGGEMSLGITGLEGQNQSDLAGSTSDPVIQGFETASIEAQVAGNAAGQTQAEQGELGYLKQLYKRAIAAHNNTQIQALGQQILTLISALAQNTTATAANTTATAVNTNAVTGSTSISYQGQDYAVGGTSSGSLTNLAVGT